MLKTLDIFDYHAIIVVAENCFLPDKPSHRTVLQYDENKEISLYIGELIS